MEPDFASLRLERFGIDQERGFLPNPDPMERLPEPYALFYWWEDAVAELPHLISAGRVRERIDRLSESYVRQYGNRDITREIPAFQDRRVLFRAQQVLSYFLAPYVLGALGDKEVIPYIPEGIALPLCFISWKTSIPPILSYWLYSSSNWRRLNAAEPIELGNIVPLLNFVGGPDEDGFIMVHVAMSAAGGKIPAAGSEALKACVRDDPEAAELHLRVIAEALRRMCDIFARMPDLCDRYIFYHRVRRYLFGWNNEIVPNGVVYGGVSRYGRPLKDQGESGAQDPLFMLLDLIYEVLHQDEEATPYFRDTRKHILPGHRRFLRVFERFMKTWGSIASYVASKRSVHPTLHETWVAGFGQLLRFRGQHFSFVTEYITDQNGTDPRNPNATGTGGTDFRSALGRRIVTTGKALAAAKR